METKLALNEGKYLNKLSNLSYQINVFLGLNILIMAIMTIFMSQIGTRAWINNNRDSHYYIFPEDKEIDMTKIQLRALMSFYLLFCNLLPLDMVITLLIARYMVTNFIRNDVQMVDFEKSCAERRIVGCDVKNLSLLEDFAQINHLFCDKTGTLTKNELIFKSMAIGNRPFFVQDSDFGRLSQEIKAHSDKSTFLDFFRCLCICHDVIQFKQQNSDQLIFTGSSQDEIKFLEMCRDVGLCKFIARDSDELTLEVDGQTEKYKILRVIEFNSERKRMSVIVQTHDGKVINFIKGADVTITPRITQTQD